MRKKTKAGFVPKTLFLLLGSFLLSPRPAVGDEATDLVRYYDKFDLNVIEQTIQKFLKAKTVEEKAKYVRDPDRVIPLMKAHYGKITYQPEGFESLDSTAVSFSGRFAKCQVETSDFLTSEINVIRSPKNKDQPYQVDWESWVGFSEKTPKEMKTEKPATPFLIRAWVENTDYYNYDFSDDAKWKSFTLFIGNTEESFTGYVPPHSEPYKLLQGIRGIKVPLILKVAYPTNAKNNRQLLIKEIVNSKAWILEPKEGPEVKKAPKTDDQ